MIHAMSRPLKPIIVFAVIALALALRIAHLSSATSTHADSAGSIT